MSSDMSNGQCAGQADEADFLDLGAAPADVKAGGPPATTGSKAGAKSGAKSGAKRAASKHGPNGHRPKVGKGVSVQELPEGAVKADKSEEVVTGLDMAMLTSGPLEYPETVPLQDETDEMFAQMLARGVKISDAWVELGGAEGSAQAYRRANRDDVIKRVAYLQMVGAMIRAADANWVGAQFLRISREYRTAKTKDQRDMLRGERESLGDFAKIRGLFVQKSETTLNGPSDPIEALKAMRAEVSEKTWGAITRVMELASEEAAANKAKRIKDVAKVKSQIGED